MELIFAKTSPFARKVRVVLREKDIEARETVDNPWLPDARVGSLNPLAKVPVLIRDDGHAISDSRVIVEYLETLGHAPRLIPAADADRIAAKEIEALADGICDAVILTVLEGRREPALRSAFWTTRQRTKAERGVASLESRLGDGLWFVGGAMTLADIAAGCALGYLDVRLPDFDWRARHPGLAALAGRLFQRPSFAETMPEAQEIPVTLGG